MKTREAPLKLMIREDGEQGVVRAFFATMDESRKGEVASLAVTLARMPGVLDAWKGCLAGALRHMLKDVGIEVLGVEERPVHPSEGRK